MTKIILTSIVALFALSPEPVPMRTPQVIFSEISQYSVRVRREPSKHPGVGSGTVIRSSGTSAVILTCAHVVGKEPVVMVDIDTDRKPLVTYPGLVIKTDTTLDLAIVVVIGDIGRPAAPIAELEPNLYEELYTVCCPLGIPRQSAIERLNTHDAHSGEREPSKYGITGMAIPGMSGGAIFNASGQIVAVVEAVAVYHDDVIMPAVGFAISLSDIKLFLKGV